MKLPTINQRKWKAIIAQSEKALTEITKITGEVFDLSALTTPRPKRITERAISRLKEQQITLLRTKTEEAIKNIRTPEAEQMVKKVRTREEYIRHPRITHKKPKEKHPLTAAERSARSKKAWQTRVARMTPEQYEEFKQEFVDRMKRSKKEAPKRTAPKREKQEKQPPKTKPEEAPRSEQPPLPEEQPEGVKDEVTPEGLKELFGVPLTPEEAEEWQNTRDTIPVESDMIDERVEQEIEQMYEDPEVYAHRIAPHKALFDETKNRLSVVTKNGVDYSAYYRLLKDNAKEILELTEVWLFGSGDEDFEGGGWQNVYRRSPAQAFTELVSIMRGAPLTMNEAKDFYKQYNQYDPYER